MKRNHLDKRFELIKKIDKNYKPSSKELEEAYGYLDSCLVCGKEFRWFESFEHGFEGNVHRCGCNLPERIWGGILGFLLFILKLSIGLVILPFYLIDKAYKK